MENQELQELFAAKRTTEANRRRQTELRQKLEATAVPTMPTKKRRLWPVWAGAAAASIALLIAILPLLTTHNKPISTPIARADVPTAVVPADENEPSTPEMPLETIKPIRPTRPHADEVAQATEIISIAEEPIDETEKVSTVEAPTRDLAEDAEQTTDDTPAPRIHRRSSTRLANRSNIVTVQNQPSDFQTLLASAFVTEKNTPFTLTSINL